MAMEQSLFGPSAAAVQDQLLQQDAAFGNNLTPVGLATAIGGSAGRHIGNIMGMEDPRVAEAKAVQEAVQELRSSGVDMNDPAEYFKKMAGIFGAKGLTKQAEMAAAKALEYQDKKDQRQYKLDEHNISMKTHQIGLEKAYVDLAKAKEKAAGKQGFAQLQAILKDNFGDASVESKVAAYNAFNTEGGTIESAITALKAKEAENWSEPYTIDVNGKKVRVQKNLKTGKEQAVAGNETNVSTSNTFHLPGTDQNLQFELGLIDRGQKATEETNKQLRQLNQAISLNSADSPAASSMTDVLISKAIQTGQLSNKDIARTENTGGLLERWGNYLSRGLKGQPLDMTKVDRDFALKLLRKTVRQQHNSTLEPMIAAAKRANRNPDDYFKLEPDDDTGGATTGKTSSGTSYTVTKKGQ